MSKLLKSAYMLASENFIFIPKMFILKIKKIKAPFAWGIINVSPPRRFRNAV